MGSSQTISCPGCGAQFDLTKEYLAAYGGGVASCACGAEWQVPPSEEGPWADGDSVVMLRWARFPYRCSMCNEPAVGRVLTERAKCRVQTHDAAVGRGLERAISALAGQRVRSAPVAAALDAWANSALGETIIIRYARCWHHRRWIVPRWLGWTCGLAAMPVFITSAIAGPALDSVPLFVGGCCLAVACVVVALLSRASRLAHSIWSIRGHYAWVKGCGGAFVQSLPPFAAQLEAETAAAAESLQVMAQAEEPAAPQ